MSRNKRIFLFSLFHSIDLGARSLALGTIFALCVMVVDRNLNGPRPGDFLFSWIPYFGLCLGLVGVTAAYIKYQIMPEADL